LKANGSGIAVVTEAQHGRHSRAIMVSDAAAL
jgi:hypothetical protein